MALILPLPALQQCLSMPEAISAMRQAFYALHAGYASMPQRLSVSLPQQGSALLMPCLYNTNQEAFLGLKLITVIPQNPSRHLPLSHASILLLNASTGQTLAVLEGRWLTAMRTGAVVGLATDLLAKQDAAVLALFGAGAQAPTQVLAIHCVRPLREVRVVNRDEEHYKQLVTTLHKLLGANIPLLSRARSAAEALNGASLVACATTATSPLFQRRDIAPGTHINAIGAFTPHMCEIDAHTLADSRIVVDQREAALTEAGDLLQAHASGLIAGPETWDELAELVSGLKPGRRSEDDVTCFKSVGLATQDAAIALYVYQQARARGLGLEADI